MSRFPSSKAERPRTWSRRRCHSYTLKKTGLEARIPVNSPYAKAKGAYELTTLANKTGEGDITTPEVIRGVLKALRDLGFENLAVAEAAGGCLTDLVYKALGIYDIAKEFDARVVDLN